MAAAAATLLVNHEKLNFNYEAIIWPAGFGLSTAGLLCADGGKPGPGDGYDP